MNKNFLTRFILKKNILGVIKIVTITKLKANNPKGFNICIISNDHEKLQAHKFQGNPVSIFARMKSENAKLPDNKNNEPKFNLTNDPIITVISEKNKLKNKGISIRPKGINNLNESSNVNEFVIQ